MTSWSPLVSALIAAVLAWLNIAVLLRSGLAWKIAVDRPNERSLHRAVTPRVGGLALVGAGLLVAAPQAGNLRALLALALLLAIVSAIDDRRGLPALLRLAIHGATAVVATVLVDGGLPLWQVAALSIAIVWSTNLYNFMDGADGLAGGMTVIGFGALAMASSLQPGSSALSVTTAALAAAAIGFLVHNFPPARVFMGDAGSVPLGFLAACLGLAGWRAGTWPAWFPILVFAPFVADATATLAWRLMRRERVWQAHNEHAYQRLVKSGLSHRQTTLRYYGLMLASAASALAAINWPFSAQIILLIGWGVFYAGAFAVTRRLGPSAPPR